MFNVKKIEERVRKERTNIRPMPKTVLFYNTLSGFRVLVVVEFLVKSQLAVQIGLKSQSKIYIDFLDC